ncbi:hypothetical protein EF912_12270 [Streptomyces sp. WAC07061]|uniref:hypothetical protein n=1 Tax=Streptomyces sp. WAC07061 TaxID=2487410 RepID=UPI000F774729|nr:hypothetical protein [Streptomyces sp. WAC07061]RSS57975.1 hypothetical protein EF912_12270 [Streptomyces sp. WAC07061]
MTAAGPLPESGVRRLLIVRAPSRTPDGIQWPTRDLYLASGTYTWTDRSYRQPSSLSEPGSETAYLVDPHEQRLEQGTYVFGSVLGPHF